MTLFEKNSFMFNQNRIYRVFELINFLKARPSKGMKTLVSLLDISERSVYRYLDLLAELGIKVLKDDENRYFLPAVNLKWGQKGQFGQTFYPKNDHVRIFLI